MPTNAKDPKTTPASKPAPATGDPAPAATQQIRVPAPPAQAPAAQEPRPGTAPATQPATTPAGDSPAPDATQGAPAGDDLQALIHQALQEREQEIRQEYESKDGHIAKLKRSYETQLAELRQKQTAADQARIQAALDLANENPTQAVQILAETLEHYTQREAQITQAATMTQWAHDTAQRLGLDPGDDDVVAVIESAGPLTDPEAAFNLMGELSQFAVTRARDEAKGAVKELADFKSQLQDQVRREVATALANAGSLAVDVSDVGAAPAPPDNPIANVNNPGKLIAQGLAQSGKRRRGQE